jgi:hypothetical protein
MAMEGTVNTIGCVFDIDQQRNRFGNPAFAGRSEDRVKIDFL